jgi:prepilin-type N-terminal cleavage/methylation domain-containing protein
MLVARAAEAPSSDGRPLGRVRADDGFTLVEALVAIGIIGVLMTALTPLLVKSVASVNYQGGRQVAIQVGGDAVDRARALKGSALLSGRGGTAATTQWITAVGLDVDAARGACRGAHEARDALDAAFLVLVEAVHAAVRDLEHAALLGGQILAALFGVLNDAVLAAEEFGTRGVPQVLHRGPQTDEHLRDVELVRQRQPRLFEDDDVGVLHRCRLTLASPPHPA